MARQKWNPTGIQRWDWFVDANGKVLDGSDQSWMELAQVLVDPKSYVKLQKQKKDNPRQHIILLEMSPGDRLKNLLSLYRKNLLTGQALKDVTAAVRVIEKAGTASGPQSEDTSTSYVASLVQETS